MIEQVAQALRDSKRVLVTGHRGGDGDSLGCILALGGALLELGKETVLYGPDAVPKQFAFLTRADVIVPGLRADQRFDATCVVDTGDPRLLGSDFPDESRRGTLIVIDHHSVRKEFGDLCLIDDAAAAAGVIVARLIDTLGVPLSRPIAEALWCSLYTDTGGFRYSSTNPEVLRLAAALVEAGVEPWAMTRQLFESKPEGQVRLLAATLGTIEITGAGKLASLIITDEMMRETGTDPSMIDGFINYARGIDGVEVAVQVLQAGSHCHVSFRSKGAVNVGELAASLGGGGHHNAAGCRLPGAPAEVRQRILASLEAVVAQL